MTSDQQHDIRNALLVMFRISKELKKIELSDEESRLVICMQDELVRVGKCIGMIDDSYVYK